MKDVRLLELGNKIRFERMKRDISQEKLAELANLSIRTISDIERGITDIRYILIYFRLRLLLISLYLSFWLLKCNINFCYKNVFS